MKSEKKGRTILVIEDEIPLIRAIRDKLYRSGFEIVSARTVSQGLMVMKDVKDIDAVWLDHYLLGSDDGLDFVRQLKEKKKWKDIPVFVVSNTAASSKLRDYINLGITKFFTKANFRLDEIIGEIKNHLGDEK